MRKSLGGIGSGARENRTSADARGVAVEAAGPKATEAAPPDEEAPAPALEECPSCELKLEKDWSFCSRCGRSLVEDPQKLLNIAFEEGDLDRYLFEGFLTKTVMVVGRELVLRTSIAGDHQKISDYLMEKHGERPTTQAFWDNIRSTASVSLAVVSFDGKPIGDTTEERVDWMMDRGSALTDMILNRVVLFNRAVSAWLQKKNNFLVS